MATGTVQAAAQDNTWYAGGKAGWSNYFDVDQKQVVSDTLGALQNTSTSKDALGLGAFAGYQLNPNLGFELGYDWLGKYQVDQRFSGNGVEAGLDGEAKAQMIQATMKIGFPVNDALDLQARYRYMWDVADLHADNVRYKSNQSVATLEAVYHPFRSSYVAPAPAPVVEEAPAPAPQIVEKNFALNSDVLFAFGKDSLKAEGIEALNSLYQQIVDFQPKDGSAVVVGYTDRIGSDAYNQKLSEARARTVANFLVSKGMAASKVAVEGRGEANPVTGTKCNAVKAKAQLISCLAPDRRVEVRVSGVQEVQQ